MKRPTPPQEGNKVGLCIGGSAAVRMGAFAGGTSGRYGRKRRKGALGGKGRKKAETKGLSGVSALIIRFLNTSLCCDHKVKAAT